MATTTLTFKLEHGQTLKQRINKQIDDIEPERMIRFIESMPSNNLDDPGNFLGFIYRRSLARQD